MGKYEILLLIILHKNNLLGGNICVIRATGVLLKQPIPFKFRPQTARYRRSNVVIGPSLSVNGYWGIYKGPL